MPSVFSIESINLNGSILTAKNDRLYINGEQVKNTSGIQISENFFIKGYAPISFYSRWATRGSYLNETLLNDRFMATGYVVSCAFPATGEVPLQGRFYRRKLSSVIDVSTITDFELQPREIFSQKSISYKINPDSVIGLDITVAPNEMRSISIHLLGYFPAAGHFDKMPRTYNFYTKDEPVVGNNIYEEYIQHDAVFTGFSIYCNESGTGPTTYREEITGFISGFLEKDPLYVPLSEEIIPESCDPCYKKPSIADWSGYYINTNKFNFPTGGQFFGFSGLNGFSNTSGHYYSGFNFTNEKFFYGYSDDKYGPGELIDNVGWRVAPYPETVSGFLSGYLTSGGNFIPLSLISGSGASNFPIDGLGYVIGSSGYFLSGKQYFFQNDIRPTKQKIIGFLSGYLNKSGVFTSYLKTNPLISGGSGYFANKQYFFPNGNAFIGFTGMPRFIDQLNGGFFIYSGFSFPEGSGFSGYNWPTVERELVFGFISGDINNYKDIYFSGFSVKDNQSSGYFTSGQYIFKTGNLFSGFSGETNIPYQDYEYSGFFINGPSGVSGANIVTEQILGYISGYKDLNGIFSGFTGTLSSSGYYIFDNQIKFPTGSRFSGFSGENYFYTQPGFIYSGFFATNLSGFSGIAFPDSGSGIMTGYIGSRNYYSGSGVITGAIGMRKYYGQYGSGIMTGYIGFGIIIPDTDFTNFSGMPGFEDYMGYKYSGIASDIQNNFFSGVFPDQFGGNTGILIGKIGYRNVPTKLKVSGFLKCNSKMQFTFSPSGFNYNGGNISGISGYFINDKKIDFLTGINNIFTSTKGFDGFNDQNGFDNFGYEYSGFLPIYYGEFSGIGEPYIFQEDITGYVSGVLSSNIFTIFTGFSAASGYIIDNIKYQFNPLKWKSGQNIVGFLSGQINPSNEQFIIAEYPNSGSGYYINQQAYFFPTGSGFSGFNNVFGFDSYIGYTYSGFAKFNPANNFNQQPKFQKIVGYISGIRDEFNRFTGFQDLNIISGSSGYFINNTRYTFPTGNEFSGFSGLQFFYTSLGFRYTGFSFPEGSIFTAATVPQTYTRGIMTGFIGYRLFPSGSGLLTGLIGERYVPISSGEFSGISGLFGFSDELGYEYAGNINNFTYTNLNFIGENGAVSGPGVITGYMGYRNFIKYDKTYGTGIVTKVIGYRNVPNMRPLTGIFYHKDKYGNKYPTFPFSINSGEKYKEYDSNSFGYFVSGGYRVGFDIYNSLSGLKGLNIVMEGYYD